MLLLPQRNKRPFKDVALSSSAVVTTASLNFNTTSGKVEEHEKDR
jgi:hypothetical protein